MYTHTYCCAYFVRCQVSHTQIKIESVWHACNFFNSHCVFERRRYVLCYVCFEQSSSIQLCCRVSSTFHFKSLKFIPNNKSILTMICPSTPTKIHMHTHTHTHRCAPISNLMALKTIRAEFNKGRHFSIDAFMRYVWRLQSLCIFMYICTFVCAHLVPCMLNKPGFHHFTRPPFPHQFCHVFSLSRVYMCLCQFVSICVQLFRFMFADGNLTTNRIKFTKCIFTKNATFTDWIESIAYSLNERKQERKMNENRNEINWNERMRRARGARLQGVWMKHSQCVDNCSIFYLAHSH